jgi:hypothetical protein
MLSFVLVAAEDSSEQITTHGKATPNWITDKNTGCKIWDPNPEPNKNVTATWSGQCVNGIAQGKGYVRWYVDGVEHSKDEGNFVNGKINCQGKFTWANGDVYEGNFIDGNINGKGKFTWASGYVYEGDFIDGRQTGKGKFTWVNGDVYEGDFIDGRQTGKGKFTWVNGNIYEGDFIDGKLTGRGKHTWIGGTFEGDFIDGKLTTEKKRRQDKDSNPYYQPTNKCEPCPLPSGSSTIDIGNWLKCPHCRKLKAPVDSMFCSSCKLECMAYSNSNSESCYEDCKSRFKNCN